MAGAIPTRGPLGLKGEAKPKGRKLANKAAPIKSKPSASSKLRKAAKGQPCTLRLSCCNNDPQTTVLAHIRMFGWAGTAQKPPDYLAVFACHACHDALDRRTHEHEWGFDDILRALGETLQRQHALGNIITA